VLIRFRNRRSVYAINLDVKVKGKGKHGLGGHGICSLISGVKSVWKFRNAGRDL
jgi:hypothetical protein